jgi:hypothetical protein
MRVIVPHFDPILNLKQEHYVPFNSSALIRRVRYSFIICLAIYRMSDEGSPGPVTPRRKPAARMSTGRRAPA